MPNTITDTPAAWVSGDGPDADIILYTQCVLVRNLADFPYTGQCSHSEKKAIEERILDLIQHLHILPGGQYLSFEKMDPCQANMLVERGLAPESILAQQGPRGIYCSADQSLSICINAADHITFTGTASGVQLHEIWLQMNALDDTFARLLDYAFDERLGFLTQTLGNTGTGLKASAVLHLPANAMSKAIPALGETVRRTRHDMRPVRTTGDTDSGELYRIANTSTLGQSEDEILFNAKRQIRDTAQQERTARTQLIDTAQLNIEDRIYRALGLATHARILAFEEAIAVWSTLRWGLTNSLMDHYSIRQMNELYLSSRPAHLDASLGGGSDDLTLNVERARMYRACFTP